MKRNDGHFHIGAGKHTFKPIKKYKWGAVVDFLKIRGPNNLLSLTLSKIFKSTKKVAILPFPEPGNLIEHLSSRDLRKRSDRFNQRALRMRGKNNVPVAFFDSRAYSVVDLVVLLKKFRVVKFYPPIDKKFREDSQLRKSIFSELNKKKATLMIHVFPDYKFDNVFVDKMLAEMREFPLMKIVFAHFAGFDRRILDFVKSRENAFIETSGFSSPKVKKCMILNEHYTFLPLSISLQERLVQAINYVGEEKIIYGSDNPFLRSQRTNEISLIESAVSDKNKVFRTNFEKAFF